MVHDLNFLYSEWLEEVIIYMLLKIPVLRKSEDYDSLSDENVLYLSDEFEEAVTSIDTYTIMNKNYIYIGSTKMPLEILENSKQDELCIGGKVMIKKIS